MLNAEKQVRDFAVAVRLSITQLDTVYGPGTQLDDHIKHCLSAPERIHLQRHSRLEKK